MPPHLFRHIFQPRSLKVLLLLRLLLLLLAAPVALVAPVTAAVEAPSFAASIENGTTLPLIFVPAAPHLPPARLGACSYSLNLMYLTRCF